MHVSDSPSLGAVGGTRGVVVPSAVAGAVAVSLLALAYDNGAYAVTTRNGVSILVWWSLGLAAALGLLRRHRLSPPARLAAGALAALAAWTLVTAAWAPSVEEAVSDFNRAALYLGVLLVGVLVGRVAGPSAVAAGLAAGVLGVALLALAGKLVPGWLGEQALSELLPAARSRLSFPVGYWNALAGLVALAVPLLLRGAVATGPRALRSSALAGFPLVAAVVFLASSRGGVAVGVAGGLAYVALAARRVEAALALAVGLAGGTGAVVALAAVDRLAAAPAGALPARDALLGAAAVAGAALAVAAAWAALGPVAARAASVTRRTRLAAVAATVLALVAAAALSDPAGRLEALRAAPDAELTASPQFVSEHFLSAGGSGRWQVWSEAVAQFRTHPLAGAGAGAFEPWWTERRPFAMPARDAHSLYLSSLAELGIVGLALLLAVAAASLGGVVGGVRAARDGTRESVAALGAVAAAFFVAVGIDWLWEVPAVALTALLALGASLAYPAGRAEERAGGGRLALPLAALGVVAVAGAQLLGRLEVDASRTAAARGDVAAAGEHARAAAALEPWAASAHLQVALAHEQAGEHRAAAAAIARAVERGERDWSLWLVAARISARAGDVAEARRALARARALNPLSPLFAEPAR